MLQQATEKEQVNLYLQFLESFPVAAMLWSMQDNVEIRLIGVNEAFNICYSRYNSGIDLSISGIESNFLQNNSMHTHLEAALLADSNSAENHAVKHAPLVLPHSLQIDFVLNPFPLAMGSTNKYLLVTMLNLETETELHPGNNTDSSSASSPAICTETNSDSTGHKEIISDLYQDYRNVVESSDDPILLVDEKDCVRISNVAFNGMFQLSSTDTNGFRLDQVFKDADMLERFRNRIKICRQGLQPPVQFENIIRYRDSDSRHMQISYYPVKDEASSIHGVVVIFKDTTELVRAEMAFKTFKEVIDKAGYGALITDLQGNIIYVNKSYAQMHDYKLKELISKNASVFHTDQQWDYLEQLFKLMIETRHTFTDEIWHKRKNGTAFPAMMTGTIIENDRGTPQYISVTAIDITAKQEAEEQIRHSLKEKEILLKEIHHRVKNNLQIISSLLNLQSASLDDPQLQTLLYDSQNRVKSMALIHDRLYREKDFSRIDFTEYVRDIVENLFQSYISSDRVTHSIDFQKTWFDFDIAIPLGLIINEIVSNSLKHAFPDNREGHINLVFTKESENIYTLIVADNGIGLPEKLEVATLESLGMKLIHTLVDQLEGELSMESGNGSKFTITFEYDESLWPGGD